MKAKEISSAFHEALPTIVYSIADTYIIWEKCNESNSNKEKFPNSIKIPKLKVLKLKELTSISSDTRKFERGSTTKTPSKLE